jgi:DivIVA domain-containing protein
MATTPQTIREQTFTTRFRGYVPAEVDAFLEKLAKEIGLLMQEAGRRDERIAELNRVLKAAAEHKKKAEEHSFKSQQEIKRLQRELNDKTEQQAQDSRQLAELRQRLEAAAQQNQLLEAELENRNRNASETMTKVGQDAQEIEALRSRVAALESENRELKKEEAEFNRTIKGAREIADDLIAKTRQDTHTALQQAQEEIQRFRQGALHELAQIRDEIEQLTRRRWQVREELRAILKRYLEDLQGFSGREGGSQGAMGHDYDELFEKIEFPEIAAFSEDDQDEGADDDLPTEFSAEFEGEDNLSEALKDGGVAYLSDLEGDKV